MAKGPKISQEIMFGMEDMQDPQVEVEVQESTGATISYFMLQLMQIADQSKIIHWQTRYDREHRHYGAFYEGFIEQMDTIVEAIAGKYGKDELKFKEAAIMLYDYEMAVDEFFVLVDEALRGTFCELFDRDQDSELYNLVDEILDLTNKTKYLLQFEA
jgi:adenosine deaminase